MAENKKSFVLYADLMHTVENLKDNEAGKLFKHLLRYVNDLNPVCKDRITAISFEPIKQQLKRDLKDWENTKEDRSNNGKLGNLKRWNKDLYEKTITGEITIEQAEIIAKDRQAIKPIANVAVNDTVTVNDNVTVVVKKEDATATNFENKKRQAFTELFKRITNWDEKVIYDEVGRFMNKYPSNEPNKSGGLINTWVSNYREDHLVIPFNSPKKMVI